MVATNSASLDAYCTSGAPAGGISAPHQHLSHQGHGVLPRSRAVRHTAARDAATADRRRARAERLRHRRAAGGRSCLAHRCPLASARAARRADRQAAPRAAGPVLARRRRPLARVRRRRRQRHRPARLSWAVFGGATMAGYLSSFQASAAIIRAGNSAFFLKMATLYSQPCAFTAARNRWRPPPPPP